LARTLPSYLFLRIEKLQQRLVVNRIAPSRTIESDHRDTANLINPYCHRSTFIVFQIRLVA